MRNNNRLRRPACLLLAGVLPAAVALGPGAGSAQASAGVVMIAASNAASGSTGLYYEWEANGATTWNKELVAAGFWTSPAMTVQSNGNVLIASVDYDTGTLYFFWQGYQTTTWHEEQVSAPGAAAQGQPSMAVQKIMSPGQPAYVAIAMQDYETEGSGEQPAFTYYYQQIGGTVWNSESLPGGYDGQTTPDLAVGPNNTMVAVFDPGIISDSASGFFLDEQPYLSNTWSSIHVGTGFTENQPQVEVQSSGNIIVADTIGTEGHVQGTEFYWSPADDIDSWYGESVSSTMGAVDEQGVSMADDPAAERIAITGGFSGKCIPDATEPYGGPTWTSGQIGCPGTYSGNPSIAAQADGNLVAADSGPSGQAYFYWAASGTDTWHTETLPGLAFVYGEIAIDSYTP